MARSSAYAAARRALPAASFVLGLVAGACGEDGEPLPVIAPVPAFALVDQDGRSIRTEDLRGRIWIADFVFTSCPTICPVLTAKMRGLQQRYAGDPGGIGFLSFSVDPEVDTPARLREYGQRHQADFTSWRFVTGPEEEVRRTVKDGFKLALGTRTTREGGGYDILHAGYFVLIDRNANIRSYYPTSAEGLAKLDEDLRALAETGDE